MQLVLGLDVDWALDFPVGPELLLVAVCWECYFPDAGEMIECCPDPWHFTPPPSLACWSTGASHMLGAISSCKILCKEPAHVLPLWGSPALAEIKDA